MNWKDQPAGCGAIIGLAILFIVGLFAKGGITLNPGGTGAGIYGQSLGGGPAGYFKGNVEITGSLTVQGKDFADKIATLPAKAVFVPVSPA